MYFELLKKIQRLNAHCNTGAATGLSHPPPPPPAAASGTFIMPCLQLVQIVLFIYLFIRSCIHLFIFRLFNLLKPACYGIHQQFEHSRIVHSVHTVCMCVLYLSEYKQRLVPLTA